MTTIDQGQIQLFTFKDGLLARLAHDLQLTLTRFEIRIDGDRVTARFWPDSIRVDGAIMKGKVDHGELSDADREKILRNMREDVLHTAQHPEVRFSGQVAKREGGSSRLDGELELAGRRASIGLEVREDGGRYRGEVSLTPSRWGIPPYKALAGAIKLQDRVLLRFDLAGAGHGGGGTVPV